MITWITPTLRVSNETETLTLQEAINVIKSETDGIWPVADVATFKEARQVMRLLGMTEEQIKDRCHFALTGEILK